MGMLPDPLDIPAFLLRDAHNKAEFMSMAASEMSEEVAPAKVKTKATKSKANGHTKPAVKAADKPKAKAGGKVPAKAKTAPKATPKAAKGSEKPKAPKAKVEGKKDAFGFREGTAKSKAVAMYLAKGGATLEEVKNKVGSVQLNVLNSLEAEGHEVKRVKEQREGERPVTRYFLKLKK